MSYWDKESAAKALVKRVQDELREYDLTGVFVVGDNVTISTVMHGDNLDLAVVLNSVLHQIDDLELLRLVQIAVNGVVLTRDIGNDVEQAKEKYNKGGMSDEQV